MPVCRFFQSGNCRFGENCRFEHPQPHSQSYYQGTPKTHPRTTGAFDFRGEARKLDLQDPRTTMSIDEIQHMLNDKQYLLTCMAAEGANHNVRQLIDLSPEELRLKFLECQSMNRLQDYMTELGSERERTRAILQQICSNPDLLRDAVPVPSHSEIQQLAPMGAPEPKPRSIFAPSNFMQQTQQPSPQTAQPFSQPLSQNIHSPPRPQGSLFGKPTTSGLFAPSVHNQKPRTQFNAYAESSPFDSAPQAPIPSQNTAPQYNSQNSMPPNLNSPDVRGQLQEGSEIYSAMESLKPEQLAAFQARTFTLDDLPVVPPPRELCF